MEHKYESKDLSREASILNNDTTSFVVLGKDPHNPKKRKQIKTRAPALEEIVDNQCDRKLDKKRKIDQWSNPTMHKIIADEGHNVMVLNMIFKNVLIRWDRDFIKTRSLHGWSANPLLLNESRVQ